MKTLIYILLPFLFLSACSDKESATENTETVETKEKVEVLEIPEEIKDSLTGGEILMRKGGGFMSAQIVKILKEPVEFSHCGIVIKTDTGLAIIHSLGRDYGDRDGVQPSTFQNFAIDAVDSSLCIVRPKVNDSVLLIIQEVALDYYDERYAFDYSFDLSTKDELHCSEFIHDVLYDAIQEEIFPVEQTETDVDCLLFKNFFNPEYFETVYSMKELPEIEFEEDTVED